VHRLHDQPSTRRSCPHTVSTSAASWIPSTQIRLARAVRAARFATFTDPDAEITGPAAAGGGTTSVAGRPSTRNAAGRSGNNRCRPCRSSSVTSRTVDPHHRPAEPAGRILHDRAPLRAGPPGSDACGRSGHRRPRTPPGSRACGKRVARGHRAVLPRPTRPAAATRRMPGRRSGRPFRHAVAPARPMTSDYPPWSHSPAP
jgi:hypothetical protein